MSIIPDERIIKQRREKTKREEEIKKNIYIYIYIYIFIYLFKYYEKQNKTVIKQNKKNCYLTAD